MNDTPHSLRSQAQAARPWLRASGLLPCFALVLLASTGCSDPTGFNPTGTSSSSSGGIMAPEDCPASAEWLPADGSPPPPQDLFDPLPHPNTECPFYRGGWQNFLIATHGAAGKPDLASYLDIEDVFDLPGVDKTKLEPIGQHRGNNYHSWLGVVHQAGQRTILVDQDGHTIYYGIHINQAFADFVRANGLTNAAAIQAAPADLFFPSGVVELKSAWKDIDVADGISADANAQYKKDYIWTRAWVPKLTSDPSTGQITEHDDQPDREIDVALIGLHVVYTLPGHPEFVWTSFEHVDLTQANLTTKALGRPNLAPTFESNPDAKSNSDITTPVSMQDYLLYKGGTTVQNANPTIRDGDLGFNEMNQSFDVTKAPSIYRMFPGSKSNDVNPDDAVAALNGNMTALFASNAPDDVRGHYRLLGGTWMDKPAFFTLESDLQNDSTSPLITNLTADKEAKSFTAISQHEARTTALAQGINPADSIDQDGSDSPFSILAGEDRMSNTSMESFTQQKSGFPNCFSCHNTQSITPRGVGGDIDTGPHQMEPKLINVSHVFTEVIELSNCPTNSMTNQIVCAPPAGN